MGHRTLSVGLVLRALFLHPDAYDELRDDDNPIMEGMLLIVLIAAGTAVLNIAGQLAAWASAPRLEAMKEVLLQNLLLFMRSQPWWGAVPQADFLNQFQRWYDLGWRVVPWLFGAPDPGSALLNVVVWPLLTLAGWLLYGVLAFLFARLLHGTGTLNQTLGTTALAFTPLLLRGLGFIPFLVIGGVINTWQLLARYLALRSVHRLTVGRAVWATLLPFLVYLLLWIILGFAGILALGALLGR